jgi:hypothetical protein
MPYTFMLVLTFLYAFLTFYENRHFFRSIFHAHRRLFGKKHVKRQKVRFEDALFWLLWPLFAMKTSIFEKTWVFMYFGPQTSKSAKIDPLTPRASSI